jgi:hypothetical protein
MGTAVYMKLGTVQGLTGKTTVLAGRVDLGESGMRVFGAVWAFPAVVFVLAALALFQGWDWWQPALLAVTLVSLVLTGLDWQFAFSGAIVDLAILVILWLAPRIVAS